MELTMDPAYHWNYRELPDAKLHWIGDRDSIESLTTLVSQEPGNINKLKEALNQQVGFFSLIFENKDNIFATVDSCSC